MNISEELPFLFLQNLLMNIVSGAVVLGLSRALCPLTSGQRPLRLPAGFHRGLCHSRDSVPSGSLSRPPYDSPSRVHAGSPKMANGLAGSGSHSENKHGPYREYLPPPKTRRISAEKKFPPDFLRNSRRPYRGYATYDNKNTAEELGYDVLSVKHPRNRLARLTKAALKRILMCPLFYGDLIKKRHLREQMRGKRYRRIKKEVL